jgi:hypothetical protein
MMRRIEIVQTHYQALEIWKSYPATEFRVAGAVHASVLASDSHR